MHLESVGHLTSVPALHRFHGPSRLAWGIVAAVGVVSLIVVAWGLSGPAAAGLPEASESLTYNEVTATATRLEGGGHITFRLDIETHSVDLSEYDPVAMSRLESPDRTFSPAVGSVVNKNDGHHIEAELIFETEPTVGQTLILQDLAGRAEWRLTF